MVVSTIGLREVPMVMVRHGVLPGREMAGVAALSPWFSLGSGYAMV